MEAITQNLEETVVSKPEEPVPVDEVVEGDDESQAVKKKKKKNRKKKKKGGNQGQSTPPSIPVSKLPCFSSGQFPVGELQDHPGDLYVMGWIQWRYAGVDVMFDSNTYRTTSAEKKALEKAHEVTYNELREAAEVHRQVRRDLQQFVKPGMSMIEICQYVAKMIESGAESNSNFL